MEEKKKAYRPRQDYPNPKFLNYAVSILGFRIESRDDNDELQFRTVDYRARLLNEKKEPIVQIQLRLPTGSAQPSDIRQAVSDMVDNGHPVAQENAKAMSNLL